MVPNSLCKYLRNARMYQKNHSSLRMVLLYLCLLCALGRNRTCDLLDRNQTLYPLSYERKNVHYVCKKRPSRHQADAPRLPAGRYPLSYERKNMHYVCETAPFQTPIRRSPSTRAGRHPLSYECVASFKYAGNEKGCQ